MLCPLPTDKVAMMQTAKVANRPAVIAMMLNGASLGGVRHVAVERTEHAKIMSPF